MDARRRNHLQNEDPGTCIPGLGDNKPRPQSARLTNLDRISRTSSPTSSDRSGRPRSAKASDSSQLACCMWSPPSPTEEIIEEDFVEVIIEKNTAIPFFDHQDGKIIIQGGTVVNEDGQEEADVLIDGGKIIEVGKDLEIPSDAKVLKAEGKFVIPGGIDSATHLHNPNNGNGTSPQMIDDFETGSKAALLGGTTTIFDLVEPQKGESLVQAYLEWKEDAEEKSLCDVGFAVALDSWNEAIKADMQELVKEHGVNSFKIDMEADGEEEGIVRFDNQQLIEIFECCKSLGAVIQVHAENGVAIKLNERKLKNRDITGPEAHLISRPEEVEEEAVSRAMCLANGVNVPLVICAPTSKTASERILKKRSEGQVVLVQPSIASLVVDGSHIFNQCWSHAAAFVASPPLRDDPETPEALVDNITSNGNGMFAVCSSHKTFTAAVKGEFGLDDFTAIPRGVNGIEERMSLLWEKVVASEKGTPEMFVAASSSNAAKMANIYPQKGRIAEGSDADLVIWDPEESHTISSKTHTTAADFNIFEGEKVTGVASTVLIGGKVIVFERQMNPTSRNGEIVSASAFPPTLYDIIQDQDASQEVFEVKRSIPSDAVDGKEDKTNENGVKNDTVSDGFGLTTPRGGGSAVSALLNKNLGVYQRPMSAHGIRNQNDSTFSLAGGYGKEGGVPSPRRSVKIVGGSNRSDSFW